MQVRILLFIAFILAGITASGQQAPSFKVATDKDVYMKGDSLHWQCALDGVGTKYNAVTVQLWIENVRTGIKWKYRFPMINGYAEGDLKIGADLMPGTYAYNFVLQPDFFNVTGKVTKVLAKDTILNYFFLFKDKETMLERVKTAADGSFRIRGLVFQDTAMLAFSKPGSRTEPTVNIATSLDSSFNPLVPVVTKFVSVIDPSSTRDTTKTSDINLAKSYHFEMVNDANMQKMSEVVVKDRKSNKLLKDYQEAYVSGMFRSADEITLDGLSNDDILNSGNIYNYLMMKVPGLTVTNNPTTGVQEVTWRQNAVSMYVDEFRLPDDVPLTVTPGEVALIKVYRPGSGPLIGGNSSSAAIAIYTKVGPYSRFLPASSKGNRFYIRGYDGRSMEWN